MPFLSIPLLPMALFAASLSLAPGPVNLIILSTALNHGVRAPLRFITGATLGFTALLVLTGLGLSATQALAQGWMDLLSCIGATVILYFGYGLLRAEGSLDTQNAPIPGFWQGAALQWLNPKAWIACLSGVALFNLQGKTLELIQFSTLYCVVCFCGIGAWAVLGHNLTRWLDTARKRRALNATLGACLILLALSLAAVPAQRLITLS